MKQYPAIPAAIVKCAVVDIIWAIKAARGSANEMLYLFAAKHTNMGVAVSIKGKPEDPTTRRTGGSNSCTFAEGVREEGMGLCQEEPKPFFTSKQAQFSIKL